MSRSHHRCALASALAACVAAACTATSTGAGGAAVTLAWDRPTTNADGTPLTDLAGFRFYFWTTAPPSVANATAASLGDVTTYTTPSLEPATYHFAVAALDTIGNESALSNVVTLILPAGGVGPQGADAWGRGARAAADPVVTGITFQWDTYLSLAPGSDNWPLTWCEDDHQYTSWGDGGGFGGTNDVGRVSLGFARLEGAYPDFTPNNVWGGAAAENPATFAGKVESILCLHGVLYAWRSVGSNQAGFDWKQIVRSTDKGASWEDDFPQSRVVGDAEGRPGLPYFINYGRDYTANTDGYVYTYTIRLTNPDTWEVQSPGVVWLARAPAADEAFLDTLNWEWVVGFEADGRPQWGPPVGRVPVLEDPDGVMRNSALYLPPFDRFVMVTNHTARNQGNIAIWEAPEPWGPWSLVMKQSGWPPGGEVEQTFAFGGFSPKWLGDDGECVFVWFRPDSWNSVACRFEIAGPEPPTADTVPPSPPARLRVVSEP